MVMSLLGNSSTDETVWKTDKSKDDSVSIWEKTKVTDD